MENIIYAYTRKQAVEDGEQVDVSTTAAEAGTAASALIVMHNHPSGESTPSEADIKVTRDLIRAGQLLKMELLDHVVIGNGNFSSLRALGYFYA